MFAKRPCSPRGAFGGLSLVANELIWRPATALGGCWLFPVGDPDIVLPVIDLPTGRSLARGVLSATCGILQYQHTGE